MDYADFHGAMLSLAEHFTRTRRDFPWRALRSPYRVWISEIMLQQTQAQTVVPYFARFMARYPDLAALAESDEDELLKHWEGLGYYSRARNLRRCARILIEDYGGRFPEDFARLLALPGIGRYTAGAIASLAFGLREPAVDGNVLRVLARLFDEAWRQGEAAAQRRAEARLRDYYADDHFLSSTLSPGTLNEALIELGATLCRPRGPLCGQCPCRAACLALRRDTLAERPLPKKRQKQAEEFYTVLILRRVSDGRVLVERRGAEGLLASLWQFPMLEGERGCAEVEQLLTEMGLTVQALRPLPDRQHVFSHLRWRLSACCVEVDGPLELAPGPSAPLILGEAAAEGGPGAEDGLPAGDGPEGLSWLIAGERALWASPEELAALPFSAALFSYREALRP